jgi:predicted AAA+ superfamily ATPase
LCFFDQGIKYALVERYLKNHIVNDLKQKMVFLGGPRQVGKTTVARSLLSATRNYLNWDDDIGRSRILDRELPSSGLVVFDELHKYRQWRRYLKGIYDTKDASLKILVTGSARLDFYRYGGDSLQGRYHYWRLHPLSVKELGLTTQKDLEDLFSLGGFPEPFLHGSIREARRWSREYRARIVRDDVSSVEQITDLGSLELLLGHIPKTVGSPLSVNSLREQLQVSFATTAKWLDILERMYAFFRIPPFGAPRLRAVKKEQKAYLYDWSVVDDEGLRFENMVAVHLLKYVHFMQDSEGLDYELRYYRDTTPREVDFVLCNKGNPILALECKLSETQISPALRYFHSKFPACRCIQLTLRGKKEFVTPEGIEVLNARTWLASLA